MTSVLQHMLGLQHLPKHDILFLLDLAKKFKQTKKAPVSLQGKTVVNLFFEPSTRTRLSFEAATRALGGNVLNFSPSQSSTIKGETLVDTAKTLFAIKADGFILRHSLSGSAHFLSRSLDQPVVNAGDGIHEHPTQGLLDLMTIEQHKQKIAGLTVLIVGDIAHSRVARSNIYGLVTLGAKPIVCAPPFFIPPHIKELGVDVSYDLATSIPKADVIMILRVQTERLEKTSTLSLKEYVKYYSLTENLLKLSKKNTIVMHPGPMNCGIEIDQAVATSKQSVILDQVTNGVYIRMAVLHTLIGGSK